MNYLLVSSWHEYSEWPGEYKTYRARRVVFVGRDEAMRWAWEEMEKGRNVSMERTDESPVTE